MCRQNVARYPSNKFRDNSVSVSRLASVKTEEQINMAKLIDAMYYF